MNGGGPLLLCFPLRLGNQEWNVGLLCRLAAISVEVNPQLRDGSGDVRGKGKEVRWLLRPSMACDGCHAPGTRSIVGFSEDDDIVGHLRGLKCASVLRDVILTRRDPLRGRELSYEAFQKEQQQLLLLLSGPHSTPHTLFLSLAYIRPDGTFSLKSSGVENADCNFFGQSSFGRHAIVSASSIVKVPADADLKLYAPLPCGLQTSAGAVLNTLGVKKGSSLEVLVIWLRY
jgi:hypothetical protein